MFSLLLNAEKISAPQHTTEGHQMMERITSMTISHGCATGLPLISYNKYK